MTTTKMTKDTTTTTTGNASLLAGRDVRDFTLAPPMMDIRGWTVLGPEGKPVGTIDRIMLDVPEEKPRYLSVTASGGVGHLLLPIGLGTLDRARKQVTFASLKVDTLKALPVLKDDVVTGEVERKVLGVVTGKPADTLTPQQWYKDPIFDATKLFGTKAAPATATA